MGYYDSIDFSQLPFLKKMKENSSISEPSMDFVNIVQNKKRASMVNGGGTVVAEVGVGFGASALAVCLKLSENDTYYCFDFESSVNGLLADLSKIQNVKCKIIGVGNSDKIWDSYNWNLSKMLLNMRRDDHDGIFDVAYLDGAHTFLHDGLAVCLLKQMMKIDGILILDDLFWSFHISKWGQKFGVDKFPHEQFVAQQVLRVQDIFLTSDPNFKKLSDSTYGRGIFKRIK